MRAFIALLSLVAAVQASIPGVLPYAGLPLLGAYPQGLPALGYGLAPYSIAAAPVPVPAPVLIPTPSSQFQSQDEFGNVAHGYANINSAKQEAGNAYGGVSGSYSYVDANGKLQTTNYIADDFGFRVSATNLPVASLEQPDNTLVGPEPVADTPEVAAAKAEFQAAFDEAATRHKRSTTAVLPASTLPLAYAAATPAAIALPLAAAPAAVLPFGAAPYHAHNYIYGGAPVAYSLPYGAAPAGVYPAAAPAIVPAGIESTLTKIQNNPGHAISYRID